MTLPSESALSGGEAFGEEPIRTNHGGRSRVGAFSRFATVPDLELERCEGSDVIEWVRVCLDVGNVDEGAIAQPERCVPNSARVGRRQLSEYGLHQTLVLTGAIGLRSIANNNGAHGTLLAVRW
jgi:hypothetical protein